VRRGLWIECVFGLTLATVEFESDPQKAAYNLRKHKVSFSEAATVFGDPLGMTIADPSHSLDENRFLTIGRSEQNRLLIISHVDNNERVRLISARCLTRSERKAYEEKIKK
jgi:uncharacterized DUF497 family protein